MELNYFLGAIYSLLKVKFLGKRIPLAVGWALTYRCNKNCLYCGAWKTQWPELSTPEILSIADQLKENGTRWVSLTGGEPLLRDDIEEVVTYLRHLKIYVSLNSNGSLIADKIKELRCVNNIKLSLDGPESINDRIRGKGSFEEVMQAISLCKNCKIPVSLECVLSEYNLDSVDFLMQLAIDKRLKVHFQPATANILRTKQVNPIAPEQSKYRDTINKLIMLKKRGLPIYNSLAGLRHLYYWPNLSYMPCCAGKLSIRLEPDATVVACDRIPENAASSPDGRKSIRRQISEIDKVGKCGNCWCSSLVELNLLYSFSLPAIFNYLNNENIIC